MELKLRFIFIISCWPRGPTSYRIRRCPDWGYLGADKFEDPGKLRTWLKLCRGFDQVAATKGLAFPTYVSHFILSLQ
jgi:hypothetical protein